MKFYFVQTFIFLSSFTFSQEPDSVLRQLEKLSDTAKVRVLNNVAFDIRDTKPEVAFGYSNHALIIAQKSNYQYGIADSYKIMATCRHYQGKYNEAIKYFLLSLKEFETLIRNSSDENEIRRAKKGMASDYNNMGLVYYAQSNNEKATENYTKAMLLKEELGDKLGVASTLR